MPLIEELASQLKSDVADLKHVGERYGGAITAALFLREFVEQIPWIHCDIPGAVYADRPSGVYPKGATGHAVATFLKLVEGFSSGVALPRQPTSAESRTAEPPRGRRKASQRSSRGAAERPKARGSARRAEEASGAKRPRGGRSR
jgi:hypothetical protein